MPSGRNDSERAVKRARRWSGPRLRGQMTLEKLVWERLEKGRTGFRFRRQFPMGPYVLDFCCPALRLAVEIDGPDHDFRRAKDAQRDRHMAERGVVVLRIPANFAYEQTDRAIEQIIEACRSQFKA